MFGVFTVPRIVHGVAAIEQLSALDTRRTTVIVSPSVAPSIRAQRVTEELAKAGTSVATVVRPPDASSVAAREALAAKLVETGPDWIIALGGGRTVDAARAAWLRYERPELAGAPPLPLADLGLRRRARFVAIPTTSGSGAEASTSMTWATAAGPPVEIVSRELLPDWVLLDPSFPAALSAPQTASTGAEALAHGLEALVSAWSTLFSDAMARASIVTLLENLPKVVRRLDDVELRETVHLAATQAGIGLANAQGGIVTALARALAATGALDYATAAAVLLPYGVEFNHPVARDRYGPFARNGALVGSGRSPLADRLRTVWKEIGLPRTLADTGFALAADSPERSALARAASASAGARSNPRVPSEEEVGRLLDCAMTGTSVAF